MTQPTAESTKPVVLFLCTHNSVRSQMAESVLRTRAGNRFQAASAGVEPTSVHPFTLRVLSEAGFDVRGLHSKSSEVFLGKMRVRYAVIVCERAQQQCPRVYPFAAQTLFWPFDDPGALEGTEGERLAEFRRVLAQITDQIDTWLAGSPA